MTGRAKTLADVTYENLVRLRRTRQQLNGPIEEWGLSAFRGMLVYLTRSLDGFVELTRQEERATLEQLLSLPVNSVWLEMLQDIYHVLGLAQITEEDSLHLKQSEKFYRRMLDMGYGTVGAVIEALQRREAPQRLVRETCLNAYLHREVREAIMQGYGFIPLIPPERQKPSQQI